MKVTDADEIRNIIKDYLKYYDYYTPESTSRARATRGATQTIPTATWTKVQYNTVDFDGLDEYDNVTNYRYTAKKEGCRQVNALIVSASVPWVSTNVWLLALYKNGVLVSYGTRFIAQASITTYAPAQFNDIIYLNANDYIEIFNWHNQGGNVNIYADPTLNYFSIHRLS